MYEVNRISQLVREPDFCKELCDTVRNVPSETFLAWFISQGKEEGIPFSGAPVNLVCNEHVVNHTGG